MKKYADKILLVFTLAAVIALSAVRFFQYISLIDFSTGFYYSGAESGGVLLYILMGVCCAVIIALAVIGNRCGADAFRVSSDGMGSHATQYLGIAEIAAAVVTAVPLFTGQEEIMFVFGIILAGRALAASGFLLLLNIKPPAVSGHVLLIWTIFLFFRGAAVFNSDLIILNHSDTLIELMAYVAGMCFAASMARFYARIEEKNTRRREIIFAALAFVCSSLHVIPKFIAKLSGGDTITGMSEITPDLAAVMITSLMFLIVTALTKKNKDIDVIDLYGEENQKN